MHRKKGGVKLVLRLRRDITVPIEPRAAKRLVAKLNQLIPAAKERELQRIIRKHKLQEIMEEKLKSGLTIAKTGSPLLLQKQVEAEKEMENETGRKMEEENPD